MIGFPLFLQALHKLIDDGKPGWRVKARQYTAKVVEAGRFPSKGTAYWSEIRSVFVELHLRKCAFCERDMAALPFGGNEQAVEHYRPKGRTKTWSAEATEEFWAEVGDDLTDGRAEGYYWLAYNEENYVTACATCNSRLKADYLPIFGTPGNPMQSPLQRASEKPAIVFPIGDSTTIPRHCSPFAASCCYLRARNGTRSDALS